MAELGNPQREVFNLSKYNTWKANGTVSLQKMGQNAVYLVKDRFDPDNGQPADPIFVPVSINALCNLQTENLTKIAELQEANIVLDTIKADIEAILAE